MTTDLAPRPPARSASFALSRPAWLTGTLLVVVGCLALAALSLLAPSAPTYDPWSWIIWGREVVHLDLSTVGGPSWKPLPVLFTAPFALLGNSAAPALWLVIARAGALLALVMAFRLARRLAGEPWGIGAGLVAALALVTSTGFIRDCLAGQLRGPADRLRALGGRSATSRGGAGRRSCSACSPRCCAPRAGCSWAPTACGWPGATRACASGSSARACSCWRCGSCPSCGARASSSAPPSGPTTPTRRARPTPPTRRSRCCGRSAARSSGRCSRSAACSVGYALARKGRALAVVGLAGLGVAWLVLVALMTQAGYSGNPRYVALPARAGVRAGRGGRGAPARARACAEVAARARGGGGWARARRRGDRRTTGPSSTRWPTACATRPS